jgi:hypothetical protein
MPSRRPLALTICQLIFCCCSDSLPEPPPPLRRREGYRPSPASDQGIRRDDDEEPEAETTERFRQKQQQEAETLLVLLKSSVRFALYIPTVAHFPFCHPIKNGPRNLSPSTKIPNLTFTTPGVNFTNILRAAFLPKSFPQKITNQNC